MTDVYNKVINMLKIWDVILSKVKNPPPSSPPLTTQKTVKE